MEVARSKHGVPVRLTADRWLHIVENHDDMAGYHEAVLETVEDPDEVVQGKAGELLALKVMDDRTLVVAYREISAGNGFVITAFLTTQPDRIRKRGTLWQRP